MRRVRVLEVRVTHRPVVGVSACLLGESVRYDGGHKLDPFLFETLGRRVRWLPVCPEAECGLAVPREPMSLVGDPDVPRLVTSSIRVDLTGQLTEWIDRRLPELLAAGLTGFVLKAGSPSCGLRDVRVLPAPGDHANARPVGVGLFARALLNAHPGLFVVDEQDLHDPGARLQLEKRLGLLVI